MLFSCHVSNVSIKGKIKENTPISRKECLIIANIENNSNKFPGSNTSRKIIQKAGWYTSGSWFYVTILYIILHLFQQFIVDSGNSRPTVYCHRPELWI